MLADQVRHTDTRPKTKRTVSRMNTALGLVGGFSVPILFAVYATTDLYYPAMITLIMAIGILIGLEIPLLTRVMEN